MTTSDATTKSWIGVDFDGVLTKTIDWSGIKIGDRAPIGENIEPMIEHVKRWLAEGKNVKIVTARVARGWDAQANNWLAITEWAYDTFGKLLEVTSEKDPHMVELWDDRVVPVETNTGRIMYDVYD